MKTTHKLLTLALLLISAFVAYGATPQTPKTWEYKFEYKCTEKKANELSASGWELINMSEGNSGIYSICAFKR